MWALFGGTIDLDIASCEQAQKTVKAIQFFTKSDNALLHAWLGKIFGNPPFSVPNIVLFTDKLLAELAAKHVTEAIWLTNNSSDTAWFHRLATAATAMCFTRGRIHFVSCDGTNQYAPVQGQMFFYFGDNLSAFVEHFDPVGLIVRPIS